VVRRDEASALLYVNGELRVSIVLCRHERTKSGTSRWAVRLDCGNRPDVTIAVRMDAANENIRDYYVLPAVDMTWEKLRVAEDNGVYLDAYRFQTLNPFVAMTARIPICHYEN